MRRYLAQAAVAATLLVGYAAHAEEEALYQPHLICEKDEGAFGTSFLFYSQHPLTCIYDAGGSARQTYKGTAGILFGVDLEFQWKDVAMYWVLGPVASPDSLKGRYVGMRATARGGVGLGVQALTGNGVVLVPVGVSGGVGLGASAGISYLELTPAK